MIFIWTGWYSSGAEDIHLKQMIFITSFIYMRSYSSAWDDIHPHETISMRWYSSTWDDIYPHEMRSVIQNFGFTLPKHSGRQLLRKFRVQKFYPKLRVFEPKLRVYRTETLGFRTETSCFWKPKFRVFKPKLLVLQRFFFCLTETSGVDSGIFCDRNFGISNTTKITKFRLSGNRRNSRSFGRKWITV
jgi:hypothetical protein